MTLGNTEVKEWHVRLVCGLSLKTRRGWVKTSRKMLQVWLGISLFLELTGAVIINSMKIRFKKSKFDLSRFSENSETK